MNRLDKKTVLLFIILMLVMAINIYIYTNKILIPTMNNDRIIEQYEANKKKENGQDVVEEEVKELTDEEKLLELKSMSETDRIHYYFAKYIDCIDLEKFDEAYGYLYSEFKQNYFQDQSSFEQYVKEHYPEYLGVQYEDIERQGEYYILTVLIYNSLNEPIEEYVEQKYVIYELDFGEFALSFQV